MNLSPLHSSYSATQLLYSQGSQNRAQDAGAAEQTKKVDASSEVKDPSVIQQVPKQSPEKTADVMLNHVLNGLNALAKDGAGQERLQERLAAAREGIEQGYAQARQQLDDMGLLTEELDAEITAGYDLIQNGLNKLSGEIDKAFEQLAGQNADDEAYQVVTKVTAYEEVKQQSVSAAALNETARSHQASYAESTNRTENSLSLEILTNDGDRVRINLQQSHQDWSVSARNNGSSLELFGQESGMQWQLDIEGHLDEGEREALNSLLQDVEKLSNSFFAGDLGAALGEAMELGFDSSELAALDLNLQQASFSSSTQAYQNVQPQMPTEALEGLKGNFLSYNESYQQALVEAQALAEPKQVLNDLIDQLFPDEKVKDVWQSYNNALSEQNVS